MTQSLNGKVLIVDDNQPIRTLLNTVLSRKGLQVFEAENGMDGLKAFKEYQPQLVLLDLVMPDLTGLQVLAKIKEMDASALVVIITGVSDEETARRTIEAGAYDFLTKPVDLDRFETDIINRIFKH